MSGCREMFLEEIINMTFPNDAMYIHILHLSRSVDVHDHAMSIHINIDRIRTHQAHDYPSPPR